VHRHKGGEGSPNGPLVEALANNDDAGASVLRWPRLEMYRRVHKLLNSVDGDGRGLALYRQQSLDAQDRLAMAMKHQREPKAKRGPINGTLEDEMERTNIVAVAIGILRMRGAVIVMAMGVPMLIMLRWRQRFNLMLKPVAHFARLARKIEEIAPN